MLEAVRLLLRCRRVEERAHSSAEGLSNWQSRPKSLWFKQGRERLLTGCSLEGCSALCRGALSHRLAAPVSPSLGARLAVTCTAVDSAGLSDTTRPLLAKAQVSKWEEQLPRRVKSFLS